MTLSDWSSLAEIVGAIAVVVSLVYLARQIRQNTIQLDHNAELARGAAELDAARLMSEAHSPMVHSDRMTRIWDKGLTDPDSLDEDERRRFVWFVAQLFFVVEGLFRQHRRGFLSEESWRPFMTLVTGLLQNEIVHNWWSSGVSPFSMEFRACVDEAISGESVDPWTYTRLSEL